MDAFIVLAIADANNGHPVSHVYVRRGDVRAIEPGRFSSLEAIAAKKPCDLTSLVTVRGKGVLHIVGESHALAEYVKLMEG